MRGHRGPRRPRPAGRLGGRGRAWCAAAAERLGAAFRAERGRRSTPGPNLEARARAARYAVLARRTCCSATPPTTRPRPCCSTCCAAPGSTAWPACGPTRRHPILGLRRAETAGPVRGARASTPVDDPSNADPAFRRNRVRHEVLPLLDDVADRDVVPVLARQAELLARRGRPPRTEAGARSTPTDAAALRPRPRRCARRRRARVAAGRHPERHPPDAATVERVLAVARGEPGATEVGGGSAGRAHRGPARRSVPSAGVRQGAVTSPIVARLEPTVPDSAPTTDPDLGGDRRQRGRAAARRIAELGEEITARLRGPGAAAGRRAQGRVHVHGRPGPRHRPARRVRLHGRVVLRQRHQDERRGPHREGPRPRPRRPRRADRRGHRRLRAHPQLPAQEPAGPRPGQPRGVRPAAEGGPAEGRARRCATSGSASPTTFVVGLRPRRRPSATATSATSATFVEAPSTVDTESARPVPGRRARCRATACREP